jgi:protein-L-isoaspartate(D-aspartate) O-methyltransferase
MSQERPVAEYDFRLGLHFSGLGTMTLDLGAARLNMVENQVRTNDVTDLYIQDAMRVVEREKLCPPDKQYLAYAQAPVEYAPGWFLMEPRDVSKLLQAILPRPGERALAIAAPYAAAVLREIGLTVTEFKAGCDLKAAIDGAPYDVVISEGAVTQTPQTWRDALAVGGRLGVVERRGPVGKAKLFTRGEDGLVAGREVFDSTPPILPGFEPEPSFAF